MNERKGGKKLLFPPLSIKEHGVRLYLLLRMNKRPLLRASSNRAGPCRVNKYINKYKYEKWRKGEEGVWESNSTRGIIYILEGRKNTRTLGLYYPTESTYDEQSETNVVIRMK